MCGRFAADASVDELVEFFEIDQVDDSLPPPRYNIAPTMDVAAVVAVAGAEGPQRRLRSFRWGLVPSWQTDPRRGARLINARAETVAQRPSFRAAFARRRCIIPVLGYYEWRKAPLGPKGSTQPYFFRAHSGQPLALAGLYEFWRGPHGQALATATIITTAAVDGAGAIHDRMPMTVPASQWEAWLDPDRPAIVDCLSAATAVSLDIYPVSHAVNRVSNDAPALVKPRGSTE